MTITSVDRTATVVRANGQEWPIAGIVEFEGCGRDIQERARSLFAQEVFYVKVGEPRVFAPRNGEVVEVGVWLVADGLAHPVPRAAPALAAAGERAKSRLVGAWSWCSTPAITGQAMQAAEGSSVWERVGADSGVSPRLLYAIATGESGLRGAPHPWTLNVRGKGYYFATREAAYRHASALVAAGEEWFDVGLMQVHWRFHKGRFSSLWDAFDTNTNVAAGAAILRENFARTKSVSLAVAHYHSADPARNTPYVRSVASLLDRQAKK